tara:strand:+ start:153 stop:863 length:711 start_codon:yes stop_codon:yes gene_type:complete
VLQTIKKLLPYFLLSFYRKNLKKFHGNELLDKKMLKYINYKNGFYIEIGAHDGILNSNTYYYEKNLNWRGVLVEPSNYFKNLKKNRSKRNLFYKKICVPFKFKKKISFEQIGPYSRSNDLISSKYLKWHKTKSDEVKNIYKKTVNKNIKTSNLNDILKISKAPKLIDFFSLDVEGSELNVLKGVNFNKFNFKYLLIEITDIDKGKHLKKMFNFLKNKGYYLHDNLTSYDYLFKYNK